MIKSSGSQKPCDLVCTAQNVNWQEYGWQRISAKR